MSYGAAIPGVKIKFSDIQNLSVFSIPKFQTELLLVYGLWGDDMRWFSNNGVDDNSNNDRIYFKQLCGGHYNKYPDFQSTQLYYNEREKHKSTTPSNGILHKYLLIHIFGGGLLWTTPRQGEDLYLLNNVPMQFPEITMTIIISLFA